VSKQEVEEFVCDSCEATAIITDFSENHSLPDNWLHLTGQVDNAYAFELDLCPQCAAKVLRTLQKEL
jgi:hypothetical protein